ncbi:hypothetical protein F5146DRAFT_1149697 [Armillaria mellea]|nr:hypothetical protein F5146DRAFT_1149697 [Armillaria mellea]
MTVPNDSLARHQQTHARLEAQALSSRNVDAANASLQAEKKTKADSAIYAQRRHQSFIFHSPDTFVSNARACALELSLAKLGTKNSLSLSNDDDGEVEPPRNQLYLPTSLLRRDPQLDRGAMTKAWLSSKISHHTLMTTSHHSMTPNFEQLEPKSGIHLFSRVLPHEHLQEYLTGRFYITPSRLYSSVRLLPRGYDVPVCDDCVTVAFIAEHGHAKFSKASVP